MALATRRGGVPQQLVAGGVAQGVVDILEMVDVEKDDAELRAAPAGAGETVHEPIGQERSIRQTGEGVVHCLMRELAFQLLARGDVLDLHEVVLGAAAVVTHEADVARRPDDAAVGPEVAALVLVGVVTGRHALQHGLAQRRVVGVRVLAPPATDQLPFRTGEQVAQCLIDTYRETFEIDDRGADRGLLEPDLEPGLGLAPHPVDVDTLGLVHQRAEQLHHGAVDGGLRHDADAHAARP